MDSVVMAAKRTEGTTGPYPVALEELEANEGTKRALLEALRDAATLVPFSTATVAAAPAALNGWPTPTSTRRAMAGISVL
jgi:hypothetical protein